MKNLKQIRKETKGEEQKYMSWNNKEAKMSEGTMSTGIFDDDKSKAKDAARNLVKFLRQNKSVTVSSNPENPKEESAELEAYTKELTNYVFDDEMLDALDPSNRKTKGKRANDIVTDRLRKLGVKIR